MTQHKPIRGLCAALVFSFFLASCSPIQAVDPSEAAASQALVNQTRLDPPAGYVSEKNKVIMLGLIHNGHIESKRYSLDVVEALIREINPDYVVTEIPPDRLADAVKGFTETGEVTEPRVRVFPEYKDVLFPLSREMDFKIIPAAAWSRSMADFRRDALTRIRNDAARTDDWLAYQAAGDAAQEKMQGRGDDPYFIHSAEYDAITKDNLSVYAARFADDIGRGDWERINAAHYKLIEAALENHAGEGAVILITFGAGHKYWFLEQLRQRNDIILINPVDYLDKLNAK